MKRPDHANLAACGHLQLLSPHRSLYFAWRSMCDLGGPYHRRCMERIYNDDMLCACADGLWHAVSDRRWRHRFALCRMIAGSTADRYSSTQSCELKSLVAVNPAGRWPSDEDNDSKVPHCTETLCRLMRHGVRENPKAEIEFGTVTSKSSPGLAGDDSMRPDPEELDSIVSFLEQSIACDWVHTCCPPWRVEHRFRAVRRA